MKNLIKILSAFAFTLVLANCATIFSGTTQNISVEVIDVDTGEIIPDVKCTIADGKGIVNVLPSNPGSILVTKGNGPLNPQCKKVGYAQKSFGMGDNFNAVTIANVLFWPGFIVDAASGAMKDYPSHMKIMMEKKV